MAFPQIFPISFFAIQYNLYPQSVLKVLPPYTNNLNGYVVFSFGWRAVIVMNVTRPRQDPEDPEVDFFVAEILK